MAYGMGSVVGSVELVEADRDMGCDDKSVRM